MNKEYHAARREKAIQVRRSRSFPLLLALLAIFCTAQASFAADATAGTTQGILQNLPPGMTPQQAADLIRKNKADGAHNGQGDQPAQPGQEHNQQQFYFNAGAQNADEKPSALEDQYNARAKTKTKLKQFGYDLIGNGGSPLLIDSEGGVKALGGVDTVSPLQTGAVQDDYVLGPGDSFNITLRGQENASYDVSVSRDGTVTLPNIAPISAAGRHFGDFRADLERAVAGAFIQTRVYVSMSQIRQLSVRVVGEVQNPGVYAVTGLSTVLDAINLAGGIKKSGSLRSITVVRGDHSYNIDLYSLLLTRGPTADMSVAQGDRIVIPALGATAAISGNVRRPGIYELPHGAKSISAHALSELANGPEIRGVYRETLLQIRPDGKEELVSIPVGSTAAVRDGEILFVERAVEESLGRVTLAGDVKLPGEFSLDRARTLRDLLPSADVLGQQPYLLLGVIDRTDRQTHQRVTIPFSPLRVLEGKENRELVSDDVVRILTLDGMRALANGCWIGTPASDQTEASQGDRTGNAQNDRSGSAPGDKDGTIQDSRARAGQAGPSTQLQDTDDQNTADNAPTRILANQNCPKTLAGSVTASDMGGFSSADASSFGHTLSESSVDLKGAVRQPGLFLISPGTTLDEVILAAGGLSQDADLSQFEVTTTMIDNATGQSTTTRTNYPGTQAQFAQIVLKPFDQIIFQHVYSDIEGGTVKLAGEVRYPGTYDIIRGERLSSLIARAGGYTSVAYPLGAVFTRRSVAKREREAYEYEAEEIESGLASLALSGKASPDSSAPAATYPVVAPPYTSNAGDASDNADAGVPAQNSSTGGYVQSILARLRNTQALGRIAIIADPTILATRPDADIILEPGDSLTIPRRPASINIVGEVRSPTSILFDSSYSVSDYVNRAGGPTQVADTSNVFVVYPDGTASPASSSLFSFDRRTLAPGSTIVVPRDVTPTTDWLDISTKVLTALSQVAVTAASLAVLNRN